MMKQVLSLIISLTLASVAIAENYKIATSVVDTGGGASTSTSYRLIGKTRTSTTGNFSNSVFILGGGFLKTAYFGQQILAPLVTGITPSTGQNTGTIEITNLAGANFSTGATVKLSKSNQTDIVATNVVVVNSVKITCSLDLTGAASGLWDVTVTNADGRSGTLPSAFTVSYSAPEISSITPAKGINNAPVNITDLAGKYFRAGAAVKLTMAGNSDITAEEVDVAASTKITCRFNLTGKAVGKWHVVVTNNDGSAATLSYGFTIEGPQVEVIGRVTSNKTAFDPSLGPITLRYELSKDTEIYLDIFNMRGERIYQWHSLPGTNGGQAGYNEVVWDGLTMFRYSASTGVYLVHITTKMNGEMKTLAKYKIAVVR